MKLLRATVNQTLRPNMAQGGEKAPVRVDRAKTCPHLIRVFYADKEHHRAADFDGNVPSSEVQIHTWPDVTFLELFETLRIELNLDKRRDVKLSIALVYPKRDGKFSVTPITELSVYASERA
jgi:histone deacetylase complex subunit SAP18